ncbi:MAG: hypothetical protein LCH62_08995 [Proteobacteria bacterium]|nr:hypothetical protein [Pseudomonadota bacterium]
MISDPGGAAAALQEGLAAALRGDAEGALKAWRRARALDPADQGTVLRLGDLLIRIGRYAEADAALAEGIPSPAIARRRAVCALAFGNFAAAEAFARAALDDAAEAAQARQFLASVLIQRGDVSAARAELALAKAADPAFETAYTDDLFAANYDPVMNGAALKNLYADWAKRFCPPEVPLAAPTIGGRRLKVAYVSPDLRRHSLRHFISPILRHHDRAKIEVHAYSLSGTPDEEAQALRKLVDVWHDCQMLDDDGLAAKARQDGIDVAVDLAGHTAGAKLKAFARRLAPVQITWLGYGGTTGVGAMDWYLGDAHMAPLGSDAAFTERVWRLDRAPFAFDPPPEMPAVAPLPAQAKGHVTFGSFSRLVRINDTVIAAWAAILAQVPNSRLMLNALPFVDRSVREDYAARFARHGIAADRLDLVYTSPQPTTWAAYGQVDIALDPFPHNGGVTTFEALWMGVPIISLRARAPLGRYGDCLLSALQFDEWCADTVDRYIELAVSAARDLPKLSTLRSGLRPRMAASELCDGKGLAAALDAAYAAMFNAPAESSSGSV